MVKKLIKETIIIIALVVCAWIYASLVSLVSWCLWVVVCLLFWVVMPVLAGVGWWGSFMLMNFCENKFSMEIPIVARYLVYFIAAGYTAINVWNVFIITLNMDKGGFWFGF